MLKGYITGSCFQSMVVQNIKKIKGKQNKNKTINNNNKNRHRPNEINKLRHIHLVAHFALSF